MATGAWETLTVDEDDAVLVVRLARPPVNAINLQMIRELHECFTGYAARSDIRAAVLSAEGDRAFCAGIDLKEDRSSGAASLPGADAAHPLLDPGRPWRETQHAVRYFPVPVIAAVEGAAVGGGMGLVEATDIIFASERATFRLNEINVGRLGGASKALRMLGPYKARSMFFSGEPVPAAEFYRLGAVERVVRAGEAERFAVDFAKELARKSPIALRLAKESILRIENMPLEEAYRTEQDYTTRLRAFDDATEAARAYVERREPTWSRS